MKHAGQMASKSALTCLAAEKFDQKLPSSRSPAKRPSDKARASSLAGHLSRFAGGSHSRGNDPATRLTARQKRSAPILARLDDWLVHHRARASAKSLLGEALASITKYRDGLGRFLTDGRIEIDNNTVERTIRPIPLNRKNALDPHAWPSATLVAIAKGHKQCRIDDLLTWNYAVMV